MEEETLENYSFNDSERKKSFTNSIILFIYSFRRNTHPHTQKKKGFEGILAWLNISSVRRAWARLWNFLYLTWNKNNALWKIKKKAFFNMRNQQNKNGRKIVKREYILCCIFNFYFLTKFWKGGFVLQKRSFTKNDVEKNHIFYVKKFRREDILLW